MAGASGGQVQAFPPKTFWFCTLCVAKICALSLPHPHSGLPERTASHIVLQVSQAVSGVLGDSPLFPGHCYNHCLGFPLVCAYAPGCDAVREIASKLASSSPLFYFLPKLIGSRSSNLTVHSINSPCEPACCALNPISVVLECTSLPVPKS